jgi:hypothetical protein
MALAGVVSALRADFRRACLLFGFPLGWYLAVGQSHYVFVRYAVPLAPSICMFAAWGLELAVRRLQARLPLTPWQMGAGVAVAALLLLVPSIRNVVSWNRLAVMRDTRVLAGEWVERHVKTGESVGVVGPQYIRPELWSSPEQMKRASNTGTTGQGRGLRNELRIAYIAETGKPGYELLAFYEGKWADALNLGEPAGGAPAFVVMAEHPAWVPNEGDLPSLSDGYEPVARFLGYTEAASGAVFDPHDAVYMPFANFEGTERPGPNLTVYRRR